MPDQRNPFHSSDSSDSSDLQLEFAQSTYFKTKNSRDGLTVLARTRLLRGHSPLVRQNHNLMQRESCCIRSSVKERSSQRVNLAGSLHSLISLEAAKWNGKGTLENCVLRLLSILQDLNMIQFNNMFFWIRICNFAETFIAQLHAVQLASLELLLASCHFDERWPWQPRRNVSRVSTCFRAPTRFQCDKGNKWQQEHSH